MNTTAAADDLKPWLMVLMLATSASAIAKGPAVPATAPLPAPARPIVTFQWASSWKAADEPSVSQSQPTETQACHGDEDRGYRRFAHYHCRYFCPRGAVQQ